MKIIGLSAFYHDSAAALIVDGEIVAAAQEERFARVKHDPGFPGHALYYVLREGKISLAAIDAVVFYDKPWLTFERLLETHIAVAPKGFSAFRRAMPVWLRDKLFLKNMLMRDLRLRDKDFSARRLMFCEHHLSHAASAFYPSPFDEAVILTLDGVGEWATASVAIGRGNKIDIVRELHFPHSLGLLYSAFTYYAGFKVNSGEYKLMGLAPYGAPRFKDLILEKLVDLKEDGSFRMDLSYFDYLGGLTMTNKKFVDLFGAPVRDPEDDLTPFHMDIAASIQAVTEEIVLRMTRSLAVEFKIPNLCLAGGVALNCVANGKILRDGAFKDLWVQPAAGDAGGAIGAALAWYHGEKGQPRSVPKTDGMRGTYLGPHFSNEEIEKELRDAGAVFTRHSADEVIAQTADALTRGLAVGWFQGRMEFGPRALGARSILADPRDPAMQKTLNLKVKFRESFRPFAPSVLREKTKDWFDFDGDSPYMLLVANVRKNLCEEMNADQKNLFGIDKLNVKRSAIPAVTHIDYSARLQTVDARTNPEYHALISAFETRTGCPLLVNTSFNVRGEPIVCTPVDAFRCFMGTGLDMLSIGGFILRKEDQDPALLEDYRGKYAPD